MTRDQHQPSARIQPDIQPDAELATGPSTRQDRQARVVLGITGVLATRPDLRGVLRTADLLDEHVRWCA